MRFLPRAIFCLLVCFISISAFSQNTSWINGASGLSAGNGITTDIFGNSYAVGGWSPLVTPTFGLNSITDPIIPGTAGSGIERCKAFVARYNIKEGQPLFGASIGVDPTPQNMNCSMASGEGYVVAEDVVTDSAGNVHVLGVYKACDLELYDTAGVAILQTSLRDNKEAGPHRLFIASFDSSLTPYAIHTLSTTSNDSVHPGGLAIADDVNGVKKLYFSAAVKGGQTIFNSFGSTTNPPVSPYGGMSINALNGYEIFIGQLALDSNHLEKAILIGGSGDDYPGDVAVGSSVYSDQDDATYVVGSFQKNFSFVHIGAGLDTLSSAGLDDIFVLKFPDYILDSAYIVTAGGPYKDQALAIADGGSIAGGFISDSCVFDTTTYDSLGNTWYGGNYTGTRREVAFIGKPMFDTETWSWQDTLPDTLYDSQVNVLARGDCDEFYVGWNRAMHQGPLGLPLLPFWDYHLLQQSVDSSYNHFYFSRMMKLAETSSFYESIWSLDMLPTTWTPFSSTHVAAEIIEDIHVFYNNATDNNNQYMDSTVLTDVLAIGRFGTDVSVPIGAPSLYDGTCSLFGYTHDSCGMFLFGLDERPTLKNKLYNVCIDDSSFNVKIVFIPDTAPGDTINFQIDTIDFSGTGIIDTATGLFDPSVAGNGTHVIQMRYSYFGCEFLSTAIATIIVRDKFPTQPITSDSAWSEGLGVAAWPPHSGPDVFDNDEMLYFYCGRYSDSLGFQGVNNDTIWLYGLDDVPSGYVAAIEKCGARWATNFQMGLGGDGGYVEAMELDSINGNLFVVGTKDDTLSLIDTSGNVGPAITTNNFNLNVNTDEKGFLAQMHAPSGEVEWIYYGGNQAGENNRFHGLDLFNKYIAVVGEQTNSFTFAPQNLGNITTFRALNLMFDTNATQLARRRFGSSINDSHGDAIDIIKSDIAYDLYYTGIFGSTNNSMSNFKKGNHVTVPIQVTSSDDIYFGHATFNPGGTGNLISPLELKVFPSPGDDYAMDVEVMPEDTNNPNSPYRVFFSGYFTDSIDTLWNGGGPFITTAVNDTNQDGYIASTTANLTLNWFNNEGSFDTNESVDALVAVDTTLFAVGKFRGFPTTSLLNGLGAIPFNTEVFTANFERDGTLISNNQSNSTLYGITEGTDITKLDTSLLFTGYIGPIKHIFEFNDTLITDSDVRNAYVARMRYNGVFYKRNHEESETQESETFKTLLFPNPNDGSFQLMFNNEQSGHLSVINQMGQSVFEQDIESRIELTLSLKVPAGIYILVISSKNETQFVRFNVIN